MDIDDVSIFILKDDSFHMKNDGRFNVDSTNQFFFSKGLPLPKLLEKIKQKLRLTTAPSLYYFTHGTRFTVKDDTSLSNAISQSSAILDSNNRSSYKYNPTTWVITFPVEAVPSWLIIRM